MKIKEVFLYPEYDNAKSFYNKAKVKKYYDNDNLLVKTELYSYNTLVLTIENNKYKLNHDIKEELLLSNTTLRHIKELLKQHNWQLHFDIKTKKDVLAFENKKYYDTTKIYFDK